MNTQSVSAARESAAAPASTSISQQFAQFAANLTFEDVPARVRECAKLHMLDAAGAGKRALTAAEVIAKFMDNAELVVPRGRAEKIRDAILAVDDCSARDLARTLASR